MAPTCSKWQEYLSKTNLSFQTILRFTFENIILIWIDCWNQMDLFFSQNCNFNNNVVVEFLSSLRQNTKRRLSCCIAWYASVLDDIEMLLSAYRHEFETPSISNTKNTRSPIFKPGKTLWIRTSPFGNEISMWVKKSS